MSEELMNFEDWFAIFSDRLRKLGWNGPIDRGSAEITHEGDISPEVAAEELYKELTS